MSRAHWPALVALLASASCSVATPSPAAEPEPDASEPDVAVPYANWPDRLANMPHGMQQLALVCGRPGSDPVRDVFCSGSTPHPTSLSELQSVFGVGTGDIKGLSEVSQGRVTGLSVTGHSTALGTRSVSAINPRVIAVHLELMPYQLVAVAFSRGEQLVEIVVADPADKALLHFYVVGFRQACNANSGGCTPGDLLTPAIESAWTEVSLYDETDLNDTVLDCAPCHQPAGPGTPKLLRMQELDRPWTHWFSDQSDGGLALVADYLAAKGDEPLAGMSSDQIQKADAFEIATLVALTSPTQPNEFESQPIEDEVKASAAALGGEQPFDNSTPGVSATWREAYEMAMHGDAIAVPYHDVKVSSPAKLAAQTAAYQAYRRGDISAAQLPDVRDVFPDDPQRLAELGFGTEPGLDGRGVLLQACAECHNERLDPSVSRARFRADLQGMNRSEKDLALARLMLPPSDPLAMPPAQLRVLTEEARARAIEVLRQ